MKSLGNNVWTHGNWFVIGSDKVGYELWLFSWIDEGCTDPNEAMKRIGEFKTLERIEQFLSTKCHVQLEMHDDA